MTTEGEAVGREGQEPSLEVSSGCAPQPQTQEPRDMTQVLLFLTLFPQIAGDGAPRGSRGVVRIQREDGHLE